VEGSASYAWVPADALAGERWDPAYWLAGEPDIRSACRLPLARLGDFIELLTYGPILPGRRPVPVADGVVIIGQRELRATGLVLDRAIAVEESSDFDLPRCRVRAGDILLARSGAGCLRKKRFTVFPGGLRATVSCFVDIVRLRGIDPCYVATFLRSALGWPQVERLISGVGTPNLNFGQIRSLAVPLAPAAVQRAAARAWRKVARLHEAGDLEAAAAALDEATRRLEKRLAAASPPGGR